MLSVWEKLGSLEAYRRLEWVDGVSGMEDSGSYCRRGVGGCWLGVLFCRRSVGDCRLGFFVVVCGSVFVGFTAHF